MNPKSWRVRVGFAVGSIFLLILFLAAHLPRHKSAAQSEFEQWLSEVGPKLENPKVDDKPVPPVSIKLVARSRGMDFTLAVEPANPLPMGERVARILGIAREANLFSLHRPDPADISLVVEDGVRRFGAEFNVDDLENNTRAQALVKLMQVYAQTATSGVAQ